MYSGLLEAQATGYLNLENFSDQEFEDARVVYRQTRREYVKEQPRFASDPMGSTLHFNDTSFEDVLNGACPNLLLVLGIGQLHVMRHQDVAIEARQAEAQLEEEARQSER
jgi:hypothetical protein